MMWVCTSGHCMFGEPEPVKEVIHVSEEPAKLENSFFDTYFCYENTDRSRNVHCTKTELKDGTVITTNCWDDLVFNMICINKSEIKNITLT